MSAPFSRRAALAGVLPALAMASLPAVAAGLPAGPPGRLEQIAAECCAFEADFIRMERELANDLDESPEWIAACDHHDALVEEALALPAVTIAELQAKSIAFATALTKAPDHRRLSPLASRAEHFVWSLKEDLLLVNAGKSL